ncbi:hypothetical protein [Altererythrobacter sp. ZODW24]|uniref:hypothetical protein n=1 Tax=Altererythrobacter sp. ZODW24 TaxID=2185142 RepID=UPI000DF7267E|nr:hypothetical protein [Altererythrobacter sp. ZODW24]
MPQTPISVPAGFAPANAVGFSDPDGSLALVSSATPFPVSFEQLAAPDALEGNATASTIAGPWMPATGRPITLSLSGTWNGEVSLLRSTDGGATRLPVTIGGQPWANFTANACEPVWEEADPSASFYLDITIASGTAQFRLAN